MITFKSFKCAFENEVVKEKMKKKLFCVLITFPMYYNRRFSLSHFKMSSRNLLGNDLFFIGMDRFKKHVSYTTDLQDINPYLDYNPYKLPIP